MYVSLFNTTGPLPFCTFLKWSEDYKSDIVGFTVHPRIVNVVVCNSVQSIREVLAGKDADAFAGRPQGGLYKIHNPDDLGDYQQINK